MTATVYASSGTNRRFPWIAEAVLKNRRKQFVIDGEAVILGVDGVSDFNALHSGKHNADVQHCVLDLLAVDGEGVRDFPLFPSIDCEVFRRRMVAAPVRWRTRSDGCRAAFVH